MIDHPFLSFLSCVLLYFFDQDSALFFVLRRGLCVGGGEVVPNCLIFFLELLFPYLEKRIQGSTATIVTFTPIPSETRGFPNPTQPQHTHPNRCICRFAFFFRRLWS